MTEVKTIDSYRTINSVCRSEIKINKSTFIANSYPVISKEQAEARLSETRKEFHDARHHPYSFKIGIMSIIVKVSDDGEPSGTSGKPLLNVIEKYDLTDVLLVVTRYFGGVKLGTGGLKRAYFDAGDSCIAKCEIIEKLITKEMLLECEYNYINSLMNLIENHGIKVKENISGERVRLIIEPRISIIETFKSDFLNLTSGKGNITAF